MAAGTWRVILQVVFLFGAAPAVRGTVSGDHGAWDSIFGSRKLEEVVSIPAPSWPEGPQAWNGGIIFSDTQKNRIYRYDRRFGVRVFVDNSGQPLPSAMDWMAEPGSNGIAVDPQRGNTAYVCQHGQHGISKLDLQTKEISPMVTHFEGKRLNGPNDLTIDPAGEFLYFTDPIYAYLRKDKFYDAAYVDEACEENLGFKGVYRLSLAGPPWDLHAIDRERNPRPNGIALSPDGAYLYVSNCCQGDHLLNCTQGTVNYNVYKLGRTPEQARFIRAITFSIEGSSGARGCADGFKVHQTTGYIVGSCASGICIVGTGVPPSRQSSPSTSHHRRLLSVDPDGGAHGEAEDEGEKAYGKLEDGEEEGESAVNIMEADGDDAEGAEMEDPVNMLPGDQGNRSYESRGELAPPAPENDEVGASREAPQQGGGEHGTNKPTEVREGTGDALGTSMDVPANDRRSAAEQPEGFHETRSFIQQEEPEAASDKVGSSKPTKKPRSVSSRVTGGSAPAGTRTASEKPSGKVGLIARLEVDHKVSNILFGDDGFLYATGESLSANGGGALWRIPLQPEPHSSDELHDELR